MTAACHDDRRCTSALIAILDREPDAALSAEAIAEGFPAP